MEAVVLQWRKPGSDPWQLLEMEAASCEKTRMTAGVNYFAKQAMELLGPLEQGKVSLLVTILIFLAKICSGNRILQHHQVRNSNLLSMYSIDLVSAAGWYPWHMLIGEICNLIHFPPHTGPTYLYLTKICPALSVNYCNKLKILLIFLGNLNLGLNMDYLGSHCNI